MKLQTKPLSLLTFSLLLFVTQSSWGAACCGGGFAAPSLVVGDDKAQITTSYSYTKVTDDVGTDSLWHKRNSPETNETFKIEGAHIFRDRWQAGASVPVIRRMRQDVAEDGLGDVSATLGYEYLPDWSYNPWRPKGLGFLQVTLPTGQSIQESDSNYQLDARGRGFWAIGLGTVLTKTVRRWDLYSNLEMHRSFEKSYKNSQSNGTLKPGYGGTLGLGAGYNLTNIRLGGALTWSYEDPIDVEGTTSSNGALQRYTTAALSASYLFPKEWAATLTYSDQTLFGSPSNTSLSSGVAVLLQKRWLR